MSKLLSPVCNNQLFDNNGKMLSGGTITVYVAGTLSIAKVYANIDGGPLTNPASLNASGRIANGQLFLDAGLTYDIVVKQGTTILERYEDIAGLLNSANGVLGSSVVDKFVGDGVTINFTLSTAPDSTSSAIVAVNGLMLMPDVDYQILGSNITFVVAPTLNDDIVVRFGRLIGSISDAQRNRIYDSWITVNSQLNYTLSTNPGAISNLIVVLDGVVLTPNIDYTWNSTTELILSLVANPISGKRLSASYGDLLPIVEITTTDVVKYTTTDVYLTDYLDGGAANVKYTSVGTGAIPSNVQVELRERATNARRYGLSTAASRSANDTALSNAINSGARMVYIPHGTYLMSAAIIIQAAALGITVFGEGKQNTILSWNIDTGTSQKFATLLDGFVCFENITLENTGNDVTNSGGLISYTPTIGNGMHDSTFKNIRLKGWGAGVGASINGTSLTMSRSQVFACVFDNVEFTGCGKPIQLGVGANNNTWIRPSFWNNLGNRHIYLVEGSSNTFISPQFEPVNAAVTTGMLNAELVLSPNNMFLNAYFEPCYGILADSSPGTVIDAPLIEGFNFTIGTLSNSSILRSTNASNGGVYLYPIVSRVSLPVSRASSNPISYCVSDDNINTLTLIDARTSRDLNFKMRPTLQAHGQIPVAYRGVWQPAITGTSGTFANTYTQQLGWYIRTGQQVTVFFRIALSAKDAGMAGNAKISGLPFTVTTDTLFTSAPIFAEYRVDLTTGYSELQGETVPGASSLTLVQSGDNIVPLFLPTTGITAVSSLVGQMTYITDQL